MCLMFMFMKFCNGNTFLYIVSNIKLECLQNICKDDESFHTQLYFSFLFSSLTKLPLLKKRKQEHPLLFCIESDGINPGIWFKLKVFIIIVFLWLHKLQGFWWLHHVRFQKMILHLQWTTVIKMLGKIEISILVCFYKINFKF